MNILLIFRFLWSILCHDSFFLKHPLYNVAHICAREYSNDLWVLILIFFPAVLVFLFYVLIFWAWSLLWNFCFQRWNIEGKTWPKVFSTRRTNKWEGKTSQFKRWHLENKTVPWIGISLTWKCFSLVFRKKQGIGFFKKPINKQTHFISLRLLR